MSYHQALAFTTILLLVSASSCFAQFINNSGNQTTPPASTASPSLDLESDSTCEDQTTAFTACVLASTAPPVDVDTCDLCLDAKADFLPTEIDPLAATCDDLRAFILDEAGKCGSECFPPTNDCSDEYLAFFECFFIETIAGNRCASDEEVVDSDGNSSNGNGSLDTFFGGGSKIDDDNGAGNNKGNKGGNVDGDASGVMSMSSAISTMLVATTIVAGSFYI